MLNCFRYYLDYISLQVAGLLECFFDNSFFCMVSLSLFYVQAIWISKVLISESYTWYPKAFCMLYFIRKKKRSPSIFQYLFLYLYFLFEDCRCPSDGKLGGVGLGRELLQRTSKFSSLLPWVGLGPRYKFSHDLVTMFRSIRIRFVKLFVLFLRITFRLLGLFNRIIIEQIHWRTSKVWIEGGGWGVLPTVLLCLICILGWISLLSDFSLQCFYISSLYIFAVIGLITSQSEFRSWQ